MNRVVRCWMGLIACSATWPTFAQGPLTKPRTDTPAPEQVVQTQLAVDDTLYIGGPFTRVGKPTGSIVWCDGQSGAIRKLTATTREHVHDIADDGAGGWYVAGQFTGLANTPRSGAARISSTGSLLAWAPKAQPVNVYALAATNGRVFLGGAFTTVNSVSSVGLAAVDPTLGTTLLPTPTCDGIVLALKANSGTVYLAGEFQNVGGQPRSRTAAFVADTGALLPWNPNVAGGAVLDLEIAGPRVYMCGYFTSVAGQTRTYVASVDATTGAPHTLSLNPGKYVLNLAESNGTLYLAGTFDTVGGQPRSCLAAVDALSGTLLPWAPAVALPLNNTNPPSVTAIEASNGQVSFAGYFTDVNTQARLGAASVDAASAALREWKPEPTFYGDTQVHAIVRRGDDVALVGRFDLANSLPRPGVAAIDLPTGSVLDWAPELPLLEGATLHARALANDADRLFVIGFQIAPGNPMLFCAVHRTTGALDQNFAPAYAGDPVLDLDVHDGMVILGGGGITALDSATGDVLFVRGDINGGVLAYEPMPANNTLLFSTNTKLIKALNLDTSLDMPWSVPLQTGDAMRIEVRGDRAFISGTYKFIGGSLRNGLASLDFAGGGAPVITDWDPNANASDVRASLLGSVALLSGSFTLVGGKPRPGFAAVDVNSGYVYPWVPQIDPSSGFLEASPRWVTIRVSEGAYAGPIYRPRIAAYELPPCFGDFNGDWFLDILDFIDFQTGFAVSDPRADCDGDASLTIDDFICFQTMFAIGC